MKVWPGWVRTHRVASAFFAVVAVATVVPAFLAFTMPSPPPCLPGEHQAAAASSANPATVASTSSTTLEVADVKQTQIILGRAVAPARTEIGLKTDELAAGVDVAAPLRVQVQSFRKGDGGDVSQAVLAWGSFTSRHTAEVFLCIERQGKGDERRYGFMLEPGQFSGAVTVLDPRLPTSTIPFTVELAYPDPFVPLLPLGPLVLAGALYLMVLRRPPNDADGHVGLRDLDEFLKRPSGIAAVIAGTAAALGVYVTTYLNDTSWGSSSGDGFLLTGAMFTAFVSAGTAFRFASNLGAGDAAARSASEGEQRADPPGAAAEPAPVAGRGERPPAAGSGNDTGQSAGPQRPVVVPVSAGSDGPRAHPRRGADAQS